MKVNIDNKEFEIDIERAKELGLCKEVRKLVTSFEVGDVFEAIGHSRIVITEATWSSTGGNKRYNIAGLHGFKVFGNMGADVSNLPIHKQFLNYLNENGFVFIGNINSDVQALIDSLPSKL